MNSFASKRLIAGAIGLVYAVLYGLFTAMATGGGHGNFIWLLLFIFVEFFGLYFPLMTVIAVDLRPFVTKIVFGSLIGFNLIASSIIIYSWVTDPGGTQPSDFSKMMNIIGPGEILFSAAAHFLPTLIFAVLLIKAVIFGAAQPDEDSVLGLNLQD